MKYKTDRELIMETYNYYGKSPVYRRSIQMDLKSGEFNCAYNSDKGHCAVGRCLKAEYRNQGLNLEGNIDGINDFERRQSKDLQEMLKPSYSMINDDLWTALQDFHDESDNWWCGEGAPEYEAWGKEEPKKSTKYKYLTEIGENKLNRMLFTAEYNKNNEDRRSYS